MKEFQSDDLAGAGGIEPPNAGIKIREARPSNQRLRSGQYVKPGEIVKDLQLGCKTSARSKIRVDGFQIFDDRHGKTRCYHRANKGTPEDLARRKAFVERALGRKLEVPPPEDDGPL